MQYLTLSSPERHDIDQLLARLEYLVTMKRAREHARHTIQQQTTREISTEELDRLLGTGQVQP